MSLPASGIILDSPALSPFHMTMPPHQDNVSFRACFNIASCSGPVRLDRRGRLTLVPCR